MILVDATALCKSCSLAHPLESQQSGMNKWRRKLCTSVLNCICSDYSFVSGFQY